MNLSVDIIVTVIITVAVGGLYLLAAIQNAEPLRVF